MDSDTHKLEPLDAARLEGTALAPTTPIPAAPITPPPAPVVPAAAMPPAPPGPVVPATPFGTSNGAYPSPTVAPRPVAPPMFGGNNIIPIALIVLGALLLFTPLSFGDIFGSAIVLLIGLVFLYAYAQSRNFGFLVPGSILTGLGAGIVVESMSSSSGWVPLGLGLGFCAIWATHRAHWWALIPGGIIALAGLQDLARSNGWMGQLWGGWGLSNGGWWPFFLILAGIWLIASRNNPLKRG